MYGGATPGSGCLELLPSGIYDEIGTEGIGNLAEGERGNAGNLETGIEPRGGTFVFVFCTGRDSFFYHEGKYTEKPKYYLTIIVSIQTASGFR
jgi:hypothetical protein